MAISKRFKERLCKELLLRGMSNNVLAISSGIQRTLIGKYKTGENVPGLDNAEKIANALGYTLAEFIADPGDNYGHSVDECFKRVSAEWKKRR
jgi:transcriptional regulator with XRE-family HTH domain